MCLSLEQIEKLDDLADNHWVDWLSHLEQSHKWSKMAKSRDPLSILLTRAFDTCVRAAREGETESVSGMERAVSLSVILLSRLGFPRLGVFSWRNSSQDGTFLNAVRWIICEVRSSPHWSAEIQQWPERAADFVISRFASLMYGDPQLLNAFAPLAQRAARVLQIEFLAVCHRTLKQLVSSKIHVDGYPTPNSKDVASLSAHLLASFLKECTCYRHSTSHSRNADARMEKCLTTHNLQSFLENPNSLSLCKHIRRAITGVEGPILSGSLNSGMLWRSLEIGVDGVSLPALKYGHVLHRVCAGCGRANYLFDDGGCCPCGATDYSPGVYVTKTKWILLADHEVAGWAERPAFLCGECLPRFARVATSRQERLAKEQGEAAAPKETLFKAFIDPDSGECTNPHCAAHRGRGAKRTTVYLMLKPRQPLGDLPNHFNSLHFRRRGALHDHDA